MINYSWQDYSMETRMPNCCTKEFWSVTQPLIVAKIIVLGINRTMNQNQFNLHSFVFSMSVGIFVSEGVKSPKSIINPENKLT